VRIVLVTALLSWYWSPLLHAQSRFVKRCCSRSQCCYHDHSNVACTDTALLSISGQWDGRHHRCQHSHGVGHHLWAMDGLAPSSATTANYESVERRLTAPMVALNSDMPGLGSTVQRKQNGCRKHRQRMRGNDKCRSNTGACVWGAQTVTSQRSLPAQGAGNKVRRGSPLRTDHALLRDHSVNSTAATWVGKVAVGPSLRCYVYPQQRRRGPSSRSLAASANSASIRARACGSFARLTLESMAPMRRSIALLL
jgi:hypothetical protein